MRQDAEGREEQRIRQALARRGPVEACLQGNQGQRLIVEERDRGLHWALGFGPTPAREVLEIGCGDVSILARILSEGGALAGTGVDILPEAVEAARGRHPRLDLLVADAETMPFDDDRFDAVIASTLFSSVLSPHKRQAILAEIGRVLAPGGVLVWYDMQRPNPWNPSVRPFQAREIAVVLPAFQIRSRTLTLIPQLARRLGPATALLYPVLSRLTLLRTHTVGAARKPRG